jgi:hypothetical protein
MHHFPLHIAPCIGALSICVTTALAGPAFEISDSYQASTYLRPGYYACVSGLDFSEFTWSFDVRADGGYTVRGSEGEGQMVISDVDGTIDFLGGAFASDDTAQTYARNTHRVSDGNDVIIIRYDFGDVVTDDYCARVSD